MSKIRVTQHSGRSGSARHNDRSFLQGKSDQERQAIAPHIDSKKKDYLVWCYDKGVAFEQAELNFYKDRYSASLEATNERYRREGHSDRCKTIENLYRGVQTRPEEVILQIGDKSTEIDRNVFIECVEEYQREMRNWSKEHGDHLHLLTGAIHFDETSPHIHFRRCWDYIDKDGLTRLGQNKALEQAGVPLPDPEKPVSRYNNRKMTFDKQFREIWQKICKEHGFDIETEPRPSMRHKDKADYIADQMRREADQIISDAKEKASAIIAEANSISGRLQVAQLEAELDYYKRLEARHPEDFAQMEFDDLNRRKHERIR